MGPLWTPGKMKKRASERGERYVLKLKLVVLYLNLFFSDLKRRFANPPSPLGFQGPLGGQMWRENDLLPAHELRPHPPARGAMGGPKNLKAMTPGSGY